MAAKISSKAVSSKTSGVKTASKAAIKPRGKKRSSRRGMLVIMALFAVIIGGGVLFSFSSSSTMIKTTVSLSPEDRKIFKNVGSYLEDYKEIYDGYPMGYSELFDLEWMTDQPRDRYSNPIQYQPGSDGSSFTLRSMGLDKRMGTPDDSCLRSITKNKVSLHFFSCNL